MDNISNNDGRHPPERITLKVGTWLAGRYYVADVAGGRATLLVQTMEHERAEIEEMGKQIQAKRKQSETFGRRLSRKRVDRSQAQREDTQSNN